MKYTIFTGLIFTLFTIHFSILPKKLYGTKVFHSIKYAHKKYGEDQESFNNYWIKLSDEEQSSIKRVLPAKNENIQKKLYNAEISSKRSKLKIVKGISYTLPALFTSLYGASRLYNAYSIYFQPTANNKLNDLVTMGAALLVGTPLTVLGVYYVKKGVTLMHRGFYYRDFLASKQKDYDALENTIEDAIRNQKTSKLIVAR